MGGLVVQTYLFLNVGENVEFYQFSILKKMNMLKSEENHKYVRMKIFTSNLFFYFLFVLNFHML